MRTLYAITLTILLATAANADLGFIDFEDLTVGDQIHYMTSLTSDGVPMTGDTFVWSGGGTTNSGFAEIQAGGAAGGSGNELWFNNLNVDFDFGGSITHLILNYGEHGGNLNVEINGDFRNLGSLTQLDGLNVGGVDVSVTPSLPGSNVGILMLTGTADSFSIGGQEFAIDGVEYMVPEPAAGLLVVLGLLIARRR